ncbi:hypothetical protein QVD17_34323 [Tagetes erecta]|uniref:Cytochrome P450 n=1 Tax=Tagetes erecta TaxID=13708 RepID=A0AAD8JXQ9_TARER|nr:hypothetical protein QVD17_34323 [Tagetes erecta]
MDLQLLIIIFLTLILLYLYINLKPSNSNTSLVNSVNLPPHPWKLPIIGHLHHLSASLPHQALANLSQKLGPIVHLQLGEFTAVVISSPDLAKQVMKTNDLSFANRPKLLGAEINGYNYTDIAFAPYGDYWRQMRKICILELLSAKKVKSFESVREQETWSLVETMLNEGPVVINLTDKIFTVMNVIACRVSVGSRCKDEGKFVELIEEVISLSGGFDLSDLFPSMKLLHLVTGMRKKLMMIHRKIDKMLDDIIFDHQQRRCCDGVRTDENEDVLDVLLRLKDDGELQFPLSYDNIKAVIMDMFGAGTDTSSVIIEWAMFELIINPRVMQKLQGEIRRVLKGKEKVYESDLRELDYLRLVIKETLRVHPPFPLLLPRECREKCEIGGYTIPVGTKVITNFWKIGRDPDYWTDPECFIPERFDESLIDFKGTHFEYIPFGAGRRICPGLAMGLANVELLLTRLLYHFNWELPNGVKAEDLDRSEVFGGTLKRKTDLYLVPSAYNTM